MLIQTETPQDVTAIEQLTKSAFDGKPYCDGTEHLIINRLREAGALSLSLTTKIDGIVVGHIAFSVVTINGKDMGWYGLGPVSVMPKFQNQGIGSKMIREGLAQIRSMGAKGCVLEGNPVYYNRFGFKNYPGLIYKGAPSQEYFMALPFHDIVPVGKVEFHQAFYTGL